MSTPAGSAQAPAQERGRGCYVYAVVPGDVEVAPDTRGVGDPPGQVQLVRRGDIAALVSDVDLARPLGGPEDLMAHQQLLDAAITEAPILPMRFGAVMTSPDAVADELLGDHHDEFANALGELEGHAEYVVKGRYVERAILEEVLSENPQAAGLREQIRGGDEYATRSARMQLGEIISGAIAAKRDADTRSLGQIIGPYCVASLVREPTHQEDAVNVAMLVRTARHPELENVLDEIARQWEGRVQLRLLGPMAPYDFVVAPIPEA